MARPFLTYPRKKPSIDVVTDDDGRVVSIASFYDAVVARPILTAAREEARRRSAHRRSNVTPVPNGYDSEVAHRHRKEVLDEVFGRDLPRHGVSLEEVLSAHYELNRI